MASRRSSTSSWTRTNRPCSTNRSTRSKVWLMPVRVSTTHWHNARPCAIRNGTPRSACRFHLRDHVMRRILAVLLLSAMPAFADDTTTSGLIAEQGLAATMAELESAPVSADRNMALAAVRFLAGIEKAYQERWRIGATSSIFPAPVLGTELEPPNPSPEPMQPDFLNRIADEIVNAMRST